MTKDLINDETTPDDVDGAIEELQDEVQRFKDNPAYSDAVKSIVYEHICQHISRACRVMVAQ